MGVTNGGALAAFGPLLDPAENHLEFPRPSFYPPAAAVLHLANGLAEQQALRGTIPIDAAPLEQRRVVLGRVGAKEAKTESSLALGRAVARSGVAAQSADESFDVPIKTH